VAGQGLPDPEEEWEKRYMEELGAGEEKRVAVPA